MKIKLTKEQKFEAMQGCKFFVNQRNCINKNRNNAPCHCLISYKIRTSIKNKTSAANG